MIDGLSHVMLFVADVDRAVRWYGDALGFRPVFVHPNAYASLVHADAGLRLDLHHGGTSHDADIGHGPVVYLRTHTLDDMLAALREKGVKTGEPRSEGGSPRFVEFWDSEGNRLGLEEAR